MGLSLRRQQMADKKTANKNRGDDSAADFEYRRDVVDDIEKILGQAEPFIVLDSLALGDVVTIDRVLLRKAAEDIGRYITT